MPPLKNCDAPGKHVDGCMPAFKPDVPEERLAKVTLGRGAMKPGDASDTVRIVKGDIAGIQDHPEIIGAKDYQLTAGQPLVIMLAPEPNATEGFPLRYQVTGVQYATEDGHRTLRHYSGEVMRKTSKGFILEGHADATGSSIKAEVEASGPLEWKTLRVGNEVAFLGYDIPYPKRNMRRILAIESAQQIN